MKYENRCILQVEDEEPDIFLLRHVFKKAGIDNPMQVVTDGQMAIDYLSGTGPYADRAQYPLPCLLLLDLKLPKVGGLEVLAWMRQQSRLRGIVVVVFSSSSQPSDVERAYELGANSFIQKPSGIDQSLELAQLLKGWWLGFNCYPEVEELLPAVSGPDVAGASVSNGGGSETP